MLKEIYDGRKEVLDEIIKQTTKKIKNKLYKINYNENKELIEKLEENYNIELSSICEDVYIQGLKDGIKLMEETKLNKK